MLTKALTAQRMPGTSWEALREATGTSVERAVVGGARADRVGHALAIGYSAAIEVLFGDASASLCATEDGGNRPRAIQTRLQDGRVTGTKAWATLADRATHLLVVATEGTDAAGRPRLRVVRVRSDAPGVTLALSTTAFVPEVAHARVTLDGVAGEVLPGDGYADYVKPFRTVEDIHVHAALTGYLIGVARQRGFAHSIVERLAVVAAALVTLGAADPKAPATHIALGGVLATSAGIIVMLEDVWAAAPDDEWARWQRDRVILQVAGKARGERLARAWEAFRPVREEAPEAAGTAEEARHNEPPMSGSFIYAVNVVAQRAVGQDRAAVVPVTDGVVIALADGAGGTSNGAVAAQAVIDAVAAVAAASRPWASLLEELDRDGPRLGHGQTTAVVLSVTTREIVGASVGDSGAWLIRGSQIEDLTVGQARKPLVGAGCRPFAVRAAALGAGTLLVASDGLLRYAKPADIARVAAGADLVAAVHGLVDLVRLQSGALPDDVSVVLCRQVGL